MAAEILRDKVRGRAAWRGADLEGSDEWVFRLTGEMLDEVDAATRDAVGRGLSVPEFGRPGWGREEFAVPSFEPMARRILDELEDGLGFVVVRGVDAAAYDVDELAVLVWGLHSYLGEPVAQSVKGDYLGHVRDEGGEVLEGHYRGFKSSKAAPFHSDNCDVAVLFCVRPSKKGGLSRVASGAQVYNDVLEQHPEMVDVLCRPFHSNWRGEGPVGWKPYFTCPVFSYHAGKLSVKGGAGKIYEAQRLYDEVPRLTDEQQAALDVLKATAEADELTFALEPGDLFAFNNYAVVHGRTAYEDYGPAHERRHLMRLWLAAPNARPLADDFTTRYGPPVSGQPRGGYHPRAVTA